MKIELNDKDVGVIRYVFETVKTLDSDAIVDDMRSLAKELKEKEFEEKQEMVFRLEELVFRLEFLLDVYDLYIKIFEGLEEKKEVKK